MYLDDQDGYQDFIRKVERYEKILTVIEQCLEDLCFVAEESDSISVEDGMNIVLADEHVNEAIFSLSKIISDNKEKQND